ncbi:DMT family transporter [Novosphingobium sp. PhB165]|uniref:DMT family transporter n=1 Tax=Novosphingobium sp. PhB165 TaxID=2485105 RepID=UPI0010499CF4|nr:DMT family transporter [Novosphingobium sp. PhB165]
MAAGTGGARSTLLGVLCGVGAGALWGLVFLAPELARAFSPLELTIGRYLCYGAISALLLAPRWKSITAHLSREAWIALVWLALAGNTLYFVLLANAVQIGGIAMASIVVGFLPVTVTVVGSRDHGAVSLARLAPSLLLCAAGVICIGWQAIASPGNTPLATRALGLACAFGALVSWSAFAVGNSRWLTRLDAVSAHDWNLLIGVVTGLQSLLLVPLALWQADAARSSAQWTTFLSVSLGVAVLASITGNALWNRMSRLLPLTLVGQMILFETLFALAYALVWEHRLPTVFESAAFVLMVAAVLSCLAAHRKPASADLAPLSEGAAH